MNINFKKTKYIALALLLGFLMLVPNLMAVAAPNVTVKVDGNTVAFPDQKPYIDSNDRTMVPVRAPMEAMGCKVGWSDQTRQATIKKSGNTAVFTIGSKTYTLNDQNKTMDTQAVITGDRTAFPIRFAAEAMGARVEWDASTYTVNICTRGTDAKQVTIDCYKVKEKYGTIKYPEFEISVAPTAIYIESNDNNKYRFICTNHPEMNTCLSWEFGNPKPVGERRLDNVYQRDLSINNGAGFGIELKRGITLEYDIYDEAGAKIYEMTFNM